jgi:hypothetical protein
MPVRSGDYREEIAQASSQPDIASSPLILVSTLQFSSSPNVQWYWYLEAGASAYNVMLESTLLNLHAGMVKPTSGGGIYMGVRAAKHAALVAKKCVEYDSFDDQDLRQYEIQWKKDFGRELSLGFRIFQLRRTMSSQEIDELIRAFQDPSIVDEIIQRGDIDRPSRIILTLIENPSILNIVHILFRKEIMKILKE